MLTLEQMAMLSTFHLTGTLYLYNKTQPQYKQTSKSVTFQIIYFAVLIKKWLDLK